jgi:hypothetical protein
MLNTRQKLKVLDCFVNSFGGWESFNKDLQTGIDNGYTLDQQLDICCKTIKLLGELNASHQQ